MGRKGKQQKRGGNEKTEKPARKKLPAGGKTSRLSRGGELDQMALKKDKKDQTKTVTLKRKSTRNRHPKAAGSAGTAGEDIERNPDQKERQVDEAQDKVSERRSSRTRQMTCVGTGKMSEKTWKKEMVEGAGKGRKRMCKANDTTRTVSASASSSPTHQLVTGVKQEADISDSDFETSAKSIPPKPQARKRKSEAISGTAPRRKKTRNRKSDVESSSVEVQEKRTPPVGCDLSDVAAVLRHYEGGSSTQAGEAAAEGVAEVTCNGSGSESDWEEVADVLDEDEAGDKEKLLKSQIPGAPVEVTLEAPSFMKKKREKKKFDMKDWFRLQMNRFRRESQLDLHKVHILCLISAGQRTNHVCSDVTLQALALSLVPPDFMSKAPSVWSLHDLKRLVTWFKGAVTIDADIKEDHSDWHAVLMSRFETKLVATELELVMMFLLILRSLGHLSRYLFSLQPTSYKATDVKAKSPKNKSSDNGGDGAAAPGKIESESSSRSSNDPPVKTEKTSKSRGDTSDQNKTVTPNNKLTKKRTTTKQSSTKDLVKGKSNRGQREVITETGTKSPEGHQETPQRARARRGCAANVTYIDLAADESGAESEGEEAERPTDSTSKRRAGKGKGRGKGRSNSIERDVVDVGSSDEDFEVEVVKYRSPSATRRGHDKKDTVLSSESDESVQLVKASKKDEGSDHWVEVFLEEEQKWICVDCVRCRLNRPSELESTATQPLYYVLAYDSNKHVKDVTKRYASNYMSHTRKLRMDDEWWRETLSPYAPTSLPEAERDAAEDLEMQSYLMKKPMPTSISELKSHPLYALKRHLLKYEAIYPNTAVPVGYIKGEPVYARECVHTLHSRENWLMEARSVRLGEEAYKRVKSRKRFREPSGGEEMLLEIFGVWQTEEYIPPPAVDGKIPKNEYGNVELFKPSMLPAGTVQLKLPGLNRLARKLNVDCAAAMVGWDHHSGFSHPMMDGFIVCEEHKDILIAAWDEDQEIQQQREIEKKEKRALGNWKLLVKGLLIKEKLKHRFNFEKAPSPKKAHDAVSGKKKGQRATDLSVSWPRNRQEDKPAGKKGKGKVKEQSNLFPFEVEQL